MKKLILLMLTLTACCSSLSAMTSIDLCQKMYIDEDEFKTGEDAFYIHVGNNVWLETNTVHRDDTGLFTYNYCVSRSPGIESKMEYVKKWKCPYCYNYYAVGSPCSNKDCPSKYK